MNIHLTGNNKSNWFFVALICFVLALPLSQAMVSICSGLLLVVALIEDTWINKLNRVKQRKYILCIPVIFLLYLIATFLTLKGDKSFYDVQKTMFYLVLPLAFAFGKEINSKQKRIVFYTFAGSIFVATIITIIRWNYSEEYANFGIHNASPISHIRFSFQLILIFWFFVFLYKTNFSRHSTKRIGIFLLLAIYFTLFLLFQQSLTGIFALGGSMVFYLLYTLYKADKRVRIPVLIIIVALLIFPSLYIGSAIKKFYDIETINEKTLPKRTSLGNFYKHDLSNKAVENGRYVHLYVCADEMREEWNKRSAIAYNEPGKNGYPIYSTLKRYLTSKGLRKDAEGVKALNAKDISNVENGIANVIFENSFSIYPRIYQTIWEYYTYTTTGYANNQSFSQRIEFAKAAVSIIKKNLWFGVGPGYWKTEFAKAYKENNPRLKENLYASSHNQYLNFTVKFGIIGFLLIMSLLIYPIIKSKRYRDLLFLTFLAFMFFANFGDSNLESHMGSSFFLFFYCFFLTTNGIDYLKIDKS